MKQKSIGKNGLYNTIYQVSNILFPLVISMYVSRVLQADGIGKISYAQNIASYFVIFAALGITTYGIREIAKVKEGDDKNQVFTELWIINLITTIASTLLYIFLIFSIPKFKSDYFLYLVFSLQIFMNILNIDWFYQGSEDYLFITIRSLVIKFLSLLAVFVFVKDKNDYLIYAIISVLGITANYIFNMIHVRKFVRFNFKNINIKKHFYPLLILGITSVLASLYSKVDITMLGSMTTDSVVGLYSNAHKLVEIVISVCVALTSVYLPRLSYYFSQDSKEFDTLISYGIQILSFLAFPLMVGVFVLAPQGIVVLFGDGFIEASSTLRIFSILIVIKSFGDLLCYQVAIATGNEKKQLPAYVIAAIVNIVLNYLLIPVLLQNGAVIASVVSEALLNGIQFFVISKRLQIKISRTPIIQGILSSVIMGIAIFLVIQCSANIYLQTILGIVIGIFVYLLLNRLMKNDAYFEIISGIRKKIGLNK